MNNNAAAFYHSKAWRETQRAYMISKQYVCERCGRAARVVHHKRYITPQNICDPFVTLDWANLEALCLECHYAEHNGSQVCAEGLRFDEAGNIMPI